MLNFEVASAVRATNPPCIPLAQAWGRNFAAGPSTEPLLDLSQGVPRNAPHPLLLEALAKTASDPQAARYGSILGEQALREALATELSITYGGSGSKAMIQAQDIAITTGCNMAFLVLLMTLCPPGSSALLPVPSYFNNLMALSLQSVTPLFVPCDPGRAFKPDIQAARTILKDDRADGKKARMIVLTTPNNPTGMVMSPDELEEWFDLAKEYNVALILDETYRDFVEPKNVETGTSESRSRGRPHRLFEREDWRSTLVSIGSFSKGYRIPGHRLGSITAAPELLEQVTTVCDCMQICAPRVPQIALAPLLPELRPDLARASQQLAHRRKLFKETVSAVPGWTVDSMGGFFAYVSFPEKYLLSDKLRADSATDRPGSEDVSKILAEQVGVVTLPGKFFMPDGFDSLPAAEKLRSDRWIRFAVANVDDDVVIQLGPRLKQMNEMMRV